MPSAQELLASPQGQQTVYVRIKHQFPMSVKTLLHSAVQSAAITQATFLSLGLTLGAMLLTAIMALSLFVLSKDSIFGWYGVCVVFAILAMVSHSGLAHMLLWPTDGYWPGTATLVFLLLATACQLQFCRVLFLPDSPAKWLPRISMILGAMCASTAMAFALLPDYWTQMYVLSLVMVFLAFGLSWRLVYLAWRGGNSLALAWLAAFMPLFATVLIGLLDGVGLLENNLAYQLPMYAAAFEVILVGLALQWFAHDRHGEHERHQALQNIDPLTGFVNARAFAQITKLAWDKHAQTKQDFSIAYVQVMGTAASPTPSDRMLRRCVRVLRTVTREGDTVARLDERTLAMLLPAMGMGDDLSARLSRIVALGLMPDSTDRHNVTLGFRIAAMSRLHYHDALDELDEQLRSLLSKQDRWGGKSIRYLDTRPAQNKYKFSDSQAMSDVWEFAVNAEKHTAPAPPAAKSQARSITIAPSPQQSPPRNR